MPYTTFMRITKFGHCCLLIEESSLRVLTDPGNYNETPNITNLDVILITHEHADHCHLESLKEILANNKDVEVISHKAVAEILSKIDIPCTIIGDGEQIERKRISISSHGTKHAHLHPSLPTCQNTGYFIAAKFYYPGDCFHNPERKVDILALPVSGPWMKLSEAVDYAKELKPQIAFPVHDGMLKDNALGSSRRIPQQILEPLGIQFKDLQLGISEDL
jgi:L-ascorbate metabolism protein UlaG (beta-lactamase superfamily)